jgi:hypothetical protein
MSEGNQMPPLPNASLLNDSCSTDDAVKRKSVMIETYTEGIGHEKCDNTQKCINTVLRCTILPKKNLWTKVINLEGLISQILGTKKVGSVLCIKRLKV